MIQTYAYNSNKQLSQHINICELRCKCGKPHATLVCTELIDNIEKLMTRLGATKCVVTSGYRCPEYSVKVGGSRTDQHTLGRAVDIRFISKDTPISTKIVSCAAQDLGFRGIANINSSYTTIHLDMRTSGTYYGDEYKGGIHSVTKDFYEYYGMTISNTPNIIYSSYVGKWLSDITNCNSNNSNGYSGDGKHVITGICAKSDIANLRYRVHSGGRWLNWISKYDKSDFQNGVAGGKKNAIDAIQVDLSSDEWQVKYRVATEGSNSYLPWVEGMSDYAGVFGKYITKIQMCLVRKGDKK